MGHWVLYLEFVWDIFKALKKFVTSPRGKEGQTAWIKEYLVERQQRTSHNLRLHNAKLHERKKERW